MVDQSKWLKTMTSLDAITFEKIWRQKAWCKALERELHLMTLKMEVCRMNYRGRGGAYVVPA